MSLDRARFLLKVVRQGAQLATVCTEPAMVALATAKARDLAGLSPCAVFSIEVSLSPGVMKNCLSVGLPGTDRRGPEVAAALGAVAGDPRLGLQVLSAVRSADIHAVHTLLEQGRVVVCCDLGRQGVYARARVQGDGHMAEVAIEGSHCRFTTMIRDGRELSREEKAAALSPGGAPSGVMEEEEEEVMLERITGFSLPGLVEAVLLMEESQVAWFREASTAALSLGECALRGECPQAVPAWGVGLARLLSVSGGSSGSLSSLMQRVRVLVSSAVSARMAGVPWPVLTSAGSGNQGIVCSIPVLSVGQSARVGAEREARALVLAQAINVFLKAFTGNISALCGAVTAGAGVAAAVCWLLGGDMAQVEGAVQSVLGSLFGMICDGAKASCALKCSVGASEGVLAGYMARQGVFLGREEGIVGRSVAETMQLLEVISHELLCRTDIAILQARSLRSDDCLGASARG